MPHEVDALPQETLARLRAGQGQDDQYLYMAIEPEGRPVRLRLVSIGDDEAVVDRYRPFDKDLAVSVRLTLEAPYGDLYELTTYPEGVPSFAQRRIMVPSIVRLVPRPLSPLRVPHH